MSVVCLCLYENIVFSQPTAWLMHYDGLGRLLQAQGPRPWRTSQERQIFLFARYYITLSSGHQRRHCFLAQPQWELPQCMPEGEEPDEMIRLSDIFAQCPGIIADYDELHKTTPVDAVALEALRNRTQAIIDRAHAWFQIVPWICTQDTALRETVSLPKDPMKSVALTVAHAMLLCLAQPCEYLQISLTREDNTGVAATIKFLAREICRIADWALHVHSSADIALILIFPLQIAWFCLRNSKEDLCSIRGIMNSVVADSHGFEIGRMRHWDPDIFGQGRVGFLH
ncbi:hypothetical protein BKA59DRAFT_517920 [Fusarium tricinctum]|uniref:Transcription factor domain-containing protein n=1 Tax=Fusarium tricinctum TaxID=61284 RepID=A0A8K0W5X0_9HYPO|nr:hypothetical protein BKA59DRAFT_517920 [Fusarium tricinctum]